MVMPGGPLCAADGADAAIKPGAKTAMPSQMTCRRIAVLPGNIVVPHGLSSSMADWILLAGFFDQAAIVSVVTQRPRHRQAKAGAAAEFDRHADVAAEVAEDGKDVGEANAVARLVLRARALEQIEDAFLIALRDAAAVVGDFDLDTVVGNRRVSVP